MFEGYFKNCNFRFLETTLLNNSQSNFNPCKQIRFDYENSSCGRQKSGWWLWWRFLNFALLKKRTTTRRPRFSLLYLFALPDFPIFWVAFLFLFWFSESTNAIIAYHISVTRRNRPCFPHFRLSDTVALRCAIVFRVFFVLVSEPLHSTVVSMCTVVVLHRCTCFIDRSALNLCLCSVFKFKAPIAGAFAGVTGTVLGFPLDSAKVSFPFLSVLKISIFLQQLVRCDSNRLFAPKSSIRAPHTCCETCGSKATFSKALRRQSPPFRCSLPSILGLSHGMCFVGKRCWQVGPRRTYDYVARKLRKLVQGDNVMVHSLAGASAGLFSGFIRWEMEKQKRLIWKRCNDFSKLKFKKNRL